MNKYKARARRGSKTKARLRLTDKPRLVVFRSSVHIYGQVVMTDKLGDKVLATSSTLDKELRSKLSGKSKVEQAELVGKSLGARAVKAGLGKIGFDRSGYQYHGRVAALAKGAREAGLDF
jgi:large subunit ribosomal protein L18